MNFKDTLRIILSISWVVIVYVAFANQLEWLRNIVTFFAFVDLFFGLVLVSAYGIDEKKILPTVKVPENEGVNAFTFYMDMVTTVVMVVFGAWFTAIANMLGNGLVHFVRAQAREYQQKVKNENTTKEAKKKPKKNK